MVLTITVPLVCVEFIATCTGAEVGPHSVSAYLLTPMDVFCTLIDI